MKMEGETSSTFGYDDMGNEATYTQANGVNTGLGYDDNSRLTSLEISKTGSELFKYSYQYDDSGNITTETIAGAGSNLYRYDNND